METHRRTLTALLALTLIIGSPLLAQAAGTNPVAGIIAELINPQKLAKLGQRGANPRVQKSVYWLELARRDQQDMPNIMTQAVTVAGYTNALAAELTRDALLRNWKIADGYGCFDSLDCTFRLPAPRSSLHALCHCP